MFWVKGCVQKLRNQTRFWALSFLPGYGALRLWMDLFMREVWANSGVRICCRGDSLEKRHLFRSDAIWSCWKKLFFKQKRDSSYEENPWWRYAFARVNWLRYLRIRKWHFPLRVLYEDGLNSHRLREGVESIAVILNWYTLIGNYKFSEAAEPLTRKQGQLLMNKYVKFNNVCYVLMNDIYWNDFVRLKDGTFLHRYGIMDGKANDWYIDGSDGYKVTLYAASIRQLISLAKALMANKDI